LIVIGGGKQDGDSINADLPVLQEGPDCARVQGCQQRCPQGSRRKVQVLLIQFSSTQFSSVQFNPIDRNNTRENETTTKKKEQKMTLDLLSSMLLSLLKIPQTTFVVNK
jgi:hypothetical protein